MSTNASGLFGQLEFEWIVTPILLFFRVHHAHWIIGGLLGFALSIRLLGSGGFFLARNTDLSIPYVTFIPPLMASSIGFACASGYEVAENLGARRVRLLRVCLIVALVTIAQVVVFLSTADSTGPLGQVAATRNLAFMSGLAFLGAAIFGSHLAWLVPVATALTMCTASSEAGRYARWAIILQVDNDHFAGVLAFLALFVGLCAQVVFQTLEGPRRMRARGQ